MTQSGNGGNWDKAVAQKLNERDAAAQGGGTPPRKRRTLLKVFGALGVGTVVLVALAPTIGGSLAPGLIESKAGAQIAGLLKVDKVSLSWAGPQVIGGLPAEMLGEQSGAKVLRHRGRPGSDNVARYAPEEWHSAGSVIDASYEVLDEMARQPAPQGRPEQGVLVEGEPWKEPRLTAEPPEDLGLGDGWAAEFAAEIADDGEGEAGFEPEFGRDPRLVWLADLLRRCPDVKVLLICRTRAKVLAIDRALRERMRTL